MSKIAQTPYTALERHAPEREDLSNLADVLGWLDENASTYAWQPRPKKKGAPEQPGGPCFDLHFGDKNEAAVFKARWIGAMHTLARRL
ncbi:hypothetical protein [Acidisphaera sp. L21]|uniref:hypothetical protein n=1 Tax=Acidisphaera sp. L21 TaxID=1641851 RepID=UPI00131C3189|nr:hypothetical protein [Acidisphaera sp. L21]